METIKNYLETMFANLRNTPDVERAKSELWQMMEDKYNELIAEGVNDNTAVGTVISEFGNLDELAEDLGIHNVVEGTEHIDRRVVTLEDAGNFLADSKKQAIQIAIGVACCILCVDCPILADALNISDAIGVTGMMILIAVGVVLFIYSSVVMQKWDYLKKELCTIDFNTTDYVKRQEEHFLPTYAIWLAVGCVLCAVSFVPAVILDEMNFSMADDLSGVLLFLFIAVGVYLIVFAGNVKKSFGTLLYLNSITGVTGNAAYGNGTSAHRAGVAVGQQDRYITPAAESIMSVYWPTITCIYLCWSFLTFDWWVTWLIWPVAGIVSAILNANLKRR